MSRKSAPTPPTVPFEIIEPEDDEETFVPAELIVPPTPHLGDIVLYTMPDGVTVRPAIITAFVFDRYRNELTANLQVFVDGANDNDARGPHANATLTDWRTSVPYDESADPVPNSWHGR